MWRSIGGYHLSENDGLKDSNDHLIITVGFGNILIK